MPDDSALTTDEFERRRGTSQPAAGAGRFTTFTMDPRRDQRRRCIAGRTLVVVAIVLTSCVAPGGPVANAQDPEPSTVLVRPTGYHSERIKTIPVTRRGPAERRVAMSMRPKQVPSLHDGDRLEAPSELQVTADCHYQNPRCAGNPYAYGPVVDAWVMLARGSHVTGGTKAKTLAHKEITCTQRRHHCVLTFQEAGLRIGSVKGLPCDRADCTINFVIAAHSSHARPGDKLVVGSNTPDGTIRQDKSRLNAVRFRNPGAPLAPILSTTDRIRRSIPENRKRVVIYSQRLGHLDRNDQIVVNGTLRVNAAPLPYDVRLESQMILTDGRLKTQASGLTKRISLLKGQITEANGQNCTQAEGQCTRLKTGVTRITGRPVDSEGSDVPLFVNYVSRSNPKYADPRPGDHLEVVASGGLQVVRYPAAVKG
jgi:hypothetical protein